MRVAGPGRRPRRRHRRLAPARGRPRGHGGRPPAGGRASRPALPTPGWWRPAMRSPGRRRAPPGHAEVAVPARSAAALPALRRSRVLALVAAFLAQCTTARAHANTRIKHRLCRYAEQILHDLIADDRHRVRSGAAWSAVRAPHPGTLERGVANMRIMQEGGHEIEVVDRDRAAAIDPALAPSKEQDRRRDLLPDRRQRRCLQVHPGACRAVRRARRPLPVRDHRAAARGRTATGSSGW